MQLKRNVILIAALVVMSGFAIFDAYETRGMKEPVAAGNKKGEQAPDFELLNLESNRVRLSDYRGQKVLIHFWATWCPPCREEMPDMQRIYEEYEGQVTVLGVNLTKAEANMEDVRAFTLDFGLSFPILLDPVGRALNAYRIAVYPTTFAVNEKGTIHEVIFGPLQYEEMKTIMDSM